TAGSWRRRGYNPSSSSQVPRLRWSVSDKASQMMRAGSRYASSETRPSGLGEHVGAGGALVLGLGIDAAGGNRGHPPPLVADVVAAVHALVDLAVGEALARHLDLAQLARVTLHVRVRELLDHGGDRLVPGVINAAGQVRERFSLRLRTGRLDLVL